MSLPESRLVAMRHIDDDDQDDEDDADDKNNENQDQGADEALEGARAAKEGALEQDKQQMDGPPVGSRQEAEPPKQRARPSSPDGNIETLDDQPAEGQPAGRARDQGRLRGSRLYRATKAILLFRRATSSPVQPHRRSSGQHNQNHTQQQQHQQRRHNHHQGAARLSASTRSFVASFWRQSTADNSTCTRSSRLDSLASSGTNNYCSRSRSSFAFLNGGGGGTKNSSQASLNQRAKGDQQQLVANSSSSSNNNNNNNNSSFSLPRFIVPKMNALRLPIVCLIKSLDGHVMREVFIHRYELGQFIMDNLKVALDIRDAKYFGLKVAGSPDEQEDVRQPWLDLGESVYKQISKHSRVISIESVEGRTKAAAGGQQGPAPSACATVSTSTSTTKSVEFYLRIKYYPPNLARVQDQFLRQYLWLQLRRDLSLGKLTSSMNNLTHLMACVLQYELGDYSAELASAQVVANLNILPNQDLIEQQAIEVWRTRMVGTKRHLALMQFLRASVILETYGFDYYPVRDHQRQRAYLLGFNYAGVKTIRNGRIVNHFRWHSLGKISHERRMIIFHIYPSENSKRKQILGFKCLSNEDCQNLYMRLLEQKYFFTVDLTYFDTSIRRPSHLAESTIDQLGEHYQQQQQQQQQPSRRHQDEGRPRAAVKLNGNDQDDDDDYDEYDDDNDDEDGPEREHGRAHEDAACQLTSDWSGLSSSEARQRTLDTDLSFNDDFCAAGAGFRSSCDCAHCERAPATPRPADAPGMHKSSSLQERSRCDPADHRQLGELARYSSQPSSPECPPAPVGPRATSNPDTQEARDRTSVQRMAVATAPTRAAHSQAPPPLVRQRPVTKYAPAEFEPPPPPPPPQGARSDAPPDHAHQPTIAKLSGGPAARSASERLVDWTEQILVQPASLLASSSQWPQTGTLPGSACALEPGERIQRRQPAGSVTSDLFAQALRFSLLIVMLNLLLRLSDGVSSALIDLLSFGSRQPASSLQSAAQADQDL